MRIHDLENDVTTREAELYLTGTEIAELIGYLGSLINSSSNKTVMVYDKSGKYCLKLSKYNKHESSGFTSRQKMVIDTDC